MNLAINKISTIKISIWILGIITTIYMYKSQEILYVRYRSEYIINFLCSLVIIFYYFISNKKTKVFNNKSLFCIILLVLIYFYDIIFVTNHAIVNIFQYLFFLISCICFYLYPNNIKFDILKIFYFITKWMVLISIIGFIMMLLGYNLPNYIDDSDAFYTHVVYPVFNLNYTEEDIIPRFASTFLEPGHFGTMCVFLLYVSQFNLKIWGNIVFFIGVIISWSLAAYGLLIGALGLYFIQKKKTGLIISLILCFIGLGIFSFYYNQSDNIMYDYIYSRLEVDEDGEMVGYNRTSSYFDSEYEKLINSSGIIFGKGGDAYGSDKNNGQNITLGSAGYKRYLFVKGIVGTFLICLFIFIYYSQYKCKSSLGFLIVYLVANMIRDYPLRQIWMYLYIMGIPYLYYLTKKDNPKLQIQ